MVILLSYRRQGCTEPVSDRINWDQGCISEEKMMETIALSRGRLIGSDVTGDVTSYRYRTWWKRWVSALDRQPNVGGDEFYGWQQAQGTLNLRLVDAIAACC